MARAASTTRVLARSAFLAFSATLCVACGSAPRASSPKLTVAIQPFEGVAATDVEAVRSGLARAFDIDVVVLPSKPLPRKAHYVPRNRYRAPALLESLADSAPAGKKVLGLTDADVSTTKGGVFDWGVFGLGTVGGRSCVVSGFRLRGARFTERLQRVATHEVGHTVGLRHCSTSGCLMRDAEGKVATIDASTGRFCPACERGLRSMGALD